MNTYPSTLRKEEKKGKRQFSRQFNITQEMKTKKKNPSLRQNRPSNLYFFKT